VQLTGKLPELPRLPELPKLMDFGFSPLASGLWHPVGMEKKQPQPDPNSKFAEVKRKAAELRAKKKMVRDEEAQRAEQISRDLSEDDEPSETSRG
jgi:hypothetical protein